jgi:hypothetical protein
MFLLLKWSLWLLGHTNYKNFALICNDILLRFTKIFSCTLKNENVNFLFCCEPCCQCKEKAKVNRTKILQKFLNFTILFTDLDWQRKVKWFRRLKWENQARGSRDTAN